MAENNKPNNKSTQKRPNRRFNRNGKGRAPSQKQYEEVLIHLYRVSRVVKGGRRFRFKALVAVGDKKNKVGVGVAKGSDVQLAISKATDVAKKNMITIPIENGTIPHDIEMKVTGAHVLLKPAAPGTGIIAGGAVRTVIGVTGIKNLLTKSLGSSNKVNIAYATVEALDNLVPKSEWKNQPVKAVKTESKAKKAPAKKTAAKKAPAKKATKKEVHPPKISKKEGK